MREMAFSPYYIEIHQGWCVLPAARVVGCFLFLVCCESLGWFASDLVCGYVPGFGGVLCCVFLGGICDLCPGCGLVFFSVFSSVSG